MQQNIDNEKVWYEDNPWINRKHILMKWPFFHQARHEHAYSYMRQNARGALLEYLRKPQNNTAGKKYERLLVAPCGHNGDKDIISDIANEYYGIDISQLAIKECSANFKQMHLKESDILNNGYEDGMFDFIASFLFFHHLHKVGFDIYLREFNRILKKDGIIAIIEPSALSPYLGISIIGRKLFGNISGLVPDEAPIIPEKLNTSLDQNGFTIERFQALSFSHNRVPLPLQYFINVATVHLQKKRPYSNCGWMCLWICRKC